MHLGREKKHSMVDYTNIPRDSRRVPLETRVQFKFDRFFGFLSEFSSNISPGGMFIRTYEPQPQGTVLDLEFSLGDGFELINGRGEVMWNRIRDDSPERPAGMGIRFLELSEGSKELIYRMVDNYILEGGVPFDLSLVPPDPVSPAPAAAAPPGREPEPFDLSADPFQLEDLEPPVLPPVNGTPVDDAPPRVRQDAPVFPELETIPEPASATHLAAHLEVQPEIQTEAPPAAAPPPPEPEEFKPARWSSEPLPLLPESESWTAVPPREPEPPVYLPTPAAPREAPTPLAHYAGSARAAEQRPRVQPWLLVALAVIAVAAGLYWKREQLLSWAGLGGGETVAESLPPAPPLRLPGNRTPGNRAPGAVPGSSPTPAAAGTSEETPAAAAESPELPAAVPSPSPVPATPAPATPAPVPAASAAAELSGPPASAIERITWERTAAGTEVVLWGNGAIVPQVYSRLRLDGSPPREVVKLTGIQRPYPGSRLAVGTDQLRQVRIGYHPEIGGRELHIVFDLASPRVRVSTQEDGERLRILLQ